MLERDNKQVKMHFTPQPASLGCSVLLEVVEETGLVVDCDIRSFVRNKEGVGNEVTFKSERRVIDISSFAISGEKLEEYIE